MKAKENYGEHYPVNDAAQKQNIQIVKGLVIDVHYDLDSHTLTYDPNGGSDVTPNTATVRHGEKVVDGPLLPPTRTGFDFTGWYDDKDGKEPHNFTQGLVEDKTVYAGWVKSTPTVITYRLTIDYIYADGSRAAESKEFDLAAGEDYRVRSPYIPGYKADRTVVEGVMPEHAVTETVIYRRVYTPGGSTVIPTLPKTELKFSSADHFAYVNGYPDGSFHPDQTVTRAEMMAMINRALERTPKSAADLLAGMKVWSDNANVNAWYYIDVQEATNGHTYTKSGTRETWTKLAN